MLDQLQQLFDQRFDADAAKGLRAVYQLNITDDCEYQLTINDGHWSLTQGQADYPDIRLTMKKNTFDALLTGDTDAMSAYFSGKIKSRGDLSLAKRLKSILGKK